MNSVTRRRLPTTQPSAIPHKPPTPWATPRPSLTIAAATWSRAGTLAATHRVIPMTASGQLKDVTDPAGSKTSFAYDTLGNLVSSTDALGNQTQFGYDAVSRLVEVVDALGR